MSSSLAATWEIMIISDLKHGLDSLPLMEPKHPSHLQMPKGHLSTLLNETSAVQKRTSLLKNWVLSWCEIGVSKDMSTYCMCTAQVPASDREK